MSSKSKLAAEEDSDNSDFDANEDVCLTKKEEGFYPVKGQPGLFYKVCGGGHSGKSLKRHGPFVAFYFYCKIMLYSINYTYYSIKTVKMCFHVPFRG